MHPEIAAYPSNRFYSGKLTTDSKMILLKSHEKPFHSDSSGRFRPFVFHDLDYGSECLEGNSYSNQAEAQYAIWLFQHLSEQYPSHASNIGVIAPYLAQRRLLNRVFTKCLGNKMSSNSIIEVSTVDGFQGREKNIIIFSCTRASTSSSSSSSSTTTAAGSLSSFPGEDSNGKASHDTSLGNGIGFLKVWQRLNVAITRAKYALWIVGHAQTLRQDPEWAALLSFAHEKKSIVRIRYPPGLSTSNKSLLVPPFPPSSSAFPSADGRSEKKYKREQENRLVSTEKSTRGSKVNESFQAKDGKGAGNQNNIVIKTEKADTPVELKLKVGVVTTGPNNQLQNEGSDFPKQSKFHSTSSVYGASTIKSEVINDRSNQGSNVDEIFAGPRYLEREGIQGTSFFQISPNGTTVALSSGLKGSSGVTSVQVFDSELKAKQFVQCIVLQKTIAGFHEIPFSTEPPPPPAQPGDDLLNGLKVKRKREDSASSRYLNKKKS